MRRFRTVAIVGVGLIGGSIGLACAAAVWPTRWWASGAVRRAQDGPPRGCGD